jgi:hypothetical protein
MWDNNLRLDLRRAIMLEPSCPRPGVSWAEFGNYPSAPSGYGSDHQGLPFQATNDILV